MIAIALTAGATLLGLELAFRYFAPPTLPRDLKRQQHPFLHDGWEG